MLDLFTVNKELENKINLRIEFIHFLNDNGFVYDKEHPTPYKTYSGFQYKYLGTIWIAIHDYGTYLLPYSIWYTPPRLESKMNEYAFNIIEFYNELKDVMDDFERIQDYLFQYDKKATW